MKKEIYKELEELDSFLSKHQKKDIYNVPDDYFDKMQKSVLEKLNIEDKKPKIISFGFNKWMMGIAASLVILVAAFFAFNQDSDTSIQLANNDIIDYLNMYVDDFDEADLAKYLGDEDITVTEKTSINIDDIEDYLKENIDDIDEEDLRQLF